MSLAGKVAVAVVVAFMVAAAIGCSVALALAAPDADYGALWAYLPGAPANPAQWWEIP